jgi:hypothetical protein
MDKAQEYKNKIKLLSLVKKYKNISKACAEMGVSRQHYYNIKEIYEKGGIPALKNSGRHKPHLKKRFGKDIENMVIKISLENPQWGQTRVWKILQQKNVKISEGGVRCIWKRLKLETPQKRVKFAMANKKLKKSKKK